MDLLGAPLLPLPPLLLLQAQQRGLGLENEELIVKNMWREMQNQIIEHSIHSYIMIDPLDRPNGSTDDVVTKKMWMNLV